MASAIPTRTEDRQPVILGVGQLRNNRDRRLEQSLEPLDLIGRAITLALGDSGRADALRACIRHLDVVPVSSWAYDDLPGEVVRQVGFDVAATETAPGGHQPVRLVDDLARRIADGELRAGVVAGAEAHASLRLHTRAGCIPPWSERPGGQHVIDPSLMGSERMHRYGVAAPLRAYPLFENALRHALGQSFEEAQGWSAELFAGYSLAAAVNDAAWYPTIRSANEIATVHEGNRMICWPYPLLMNAMLEVDQAAAVVVGSVELARELGIDPSRWIYVWGGAGSSDAEDIFERSAYDQAPGMAAALDAALEQADLRTEDLDVLDLYSCFPVVPKFALLHLGLDHNDTPTSVTGGLSSFGGPGSNYCTHAITAVVRALRSSGGRGLIYGNGEYLTKHHALIVSDQPHPDGYVGGPEDIRSGRDDAPAVVDVAEGEATLETWTVPFTRSGERNGAIVIARVPSGARAGAFVDPGDLVTLDMLTDPALDPIGRTGCVSHVDGRNRFTFSSPM